MRHFQYALLAAVAAIGFASIASAADMPIKAPMMAPAVFNWTGFYVGAQVGYQWNRDEFGDPNRIGGPVGPNTFSADGLIGGLHAGYNYQINSAVIGVEGDYEWSGGSGEGVGTLAGAPFVTGHAALKWQGSIRARLGYAADTTLFYLTGGAAFGRFDLGYAFPVGAPVVDSFSKTMTGWTVGGGVEHAFSPNWTARIEYRYTDFGSADSSIVNCCAGPPSGQHHELTANAIRAAVSYKF